MNSTTTHVVKPPSENTPAPRCIGTGQRTSKIKVKITEAHTATFTWKESFSSVSAESLGGSTSSTRGILSLSILHLNSLSGQIKEPTTAINVPPMIAQRFPTTHGQSLIIVSYFTSPNSTCACRVQPIIARTSPPTAPAAIAHLFALSIKMVRAAGPTALPTMQPIDMYTSPRFMPIVRRNTAKNPMNIAKRPVQNLDTRSKILPSMLLEATALFTQSYRSSTVKELASSHAKDARELSCSIS
mmetsp:Transcript_120796/g.189477  ORF Transcript_120796/g.189477 Transcript_120796/m.189477 type:complete len:243 (-) Transcript_120796:747-1475(-)